MTSDPTEAEQPSTAPAAAHHLVAVLDLVTADVEDSAKAYARLLGRSEPSADVDVFATRIRLQPQQSGGHRVLFGVTDIEEHTRVLRRRGLDLSSPATSADPDAESHVEDLPFGVLSATRVPSGSAAATGVAPDISGVDHLVFQSPDRDRAVALFGATLGLDFRLDRRVVDGLRQLFFRRGDLVIEVVVPDHAPDDAPIALWGIAWRSNDIDTTHRRLREGGVQVSDIRTGRKPGTRVATVDDDALATRTIIIATSTPRIDHHRTDGSRE
ncbi:VOC family protein [Gordonia sp. DT219]|uniref:VOC family protein n=1 Tax=Gordonia sp. DT219 TaxID=3416658 RepID=UPI003CF4F3ED